MGQYIQEQPVQYIQEPIAQEAIVRQAEPVQYQVTYTQPAQQTSYAPPQTVSYAPPVSYAAPAQVSYAAPAQVSYAPPVQQGLYAPPMQFSQPTLMAPQIGFGATGAAPQLFGQQRLP